MLFHALLAASLAAASPVAQVVALLENMLEESRTAARDVDCASYEAVTCPCIDTLESHGPLIEETAAAVARLEARAEKLRSSSGGGSEAANRADREISAKEEERAAAVAVRDSERQVFEKASADLAAAVDQLKHAVEVLSEIGADQTATQALTAVAAAVRRADGHDAVPGGSRRAGLGAWRTKHRALLEAPFTGDYSAQAPEVMGVLKQLRDDFSGQLSRVSHTEDVAVKAHSAWLEVTDGELATLRQLYADKQGLLAGNYGGLSTADADLTTARADLAAQQQAVEDCTASMSLAEKQFESQKLVRVGEQEAIQTAVRILSGSGHDFSRELAPAGAFVQVRQSEASSSKLSALVLARSVLAGTALAHAERALATSPPAKSSPFAAVFAAVAKVEKDIEAEAAVDDAKFAWCESTTTKTDGEIAARQTDEEGLAVRIAGTDGSINAPESGLLAQIATNEAATADNQTAQAEAVAGRKEASRAFAREASHVRRSLELLKRAKKALDLHFRSAALHNKVHEGAYEFLPGRRFPPGRCAHGHVDARGKDGAGAVEAACAADAKCFGFDTEGNMFKCISPAAAPVQVEGTDTYIKIGRSGKPTASLQQRQATLLRRVSDAVSGSVRESRSRVLEALKLGSELTKKAALTMSSAAASATAPTPSCAPRSTGAPAASSFVQLVAQDADAVMTKLDVIAAGKRAGLDAAHVAEADSQAQFETSFAGLKEAHKTYRDSRSALKADLVTARAELQSLREELRATEGARLALQHYRSSFRPDCDYLEEHIEARRAARTDEAAALEAARTALRATPLFQQAEAAGEVARFGACKLACDAYAEHVDCLSCMAKVSKEGYCAGHQGTRGC